MKILVLGVTGMLGNAVFRVFSNSDGYDVWGTLRSGSGKRHFSPSAHSKLFSGIDVLDTDALVTALNTVRPDVVINCVGLIKQLAEANDPLTVLPINAMLPHRLSRLCDLVNARLIHISTDCVFSGEKGMYTEQSQSDAYDLYGKSKYIGEIHERTNTVTLRTSIIGHELGSHYALVDWFLNQKESVKGYSKAVFSGLPTVELARVIRDYVLPQPDLNGLFHVSAEPIDKFALLKLVAKTYGREIQISEDESVKIDRSLDSTLFRQETGYVPSTWPELVEMMFEQRK